MQRSFSIVHDATDLLDEEPGVEVQKLNLKPDELSGSDSEEISKLSPKILPSQNLRNKKPEALPRRKTSAGPSSKNKSAVFSDSEDSENNEDKPKKLPGEYDPNEYENLLVDPEVAEVFQYILKYTPQPISMEYKFKSFIPEFLPAVGDVDAFLKVTPPETTITGDIFEENILQLGLLVLDEPAANQSDPALLHLQLRAANDNIMSGNEQKNIVVKKIENVEKNSKVIEKWIKDISHLHKSKSSPIVRYPQPMPDIDDLMQQWPEDLEHKFKEEGFPKPQENQSVSDYIEIVCKYLQIPIAKNKIYSLHLLFCLYTAIKQTQLYQSQTVVNVDEKKKEKNEVKSEDIADQLVLD